MRTNFSIARKAKIRSDIKEHEQRCAKQMLLEKTEVKTNADRIRAMSDGELAKVLNAFTAYFDECNRSLTDTDCHDCELCNLCCLGEGKAIDWLKQPAE